MGDLLSIQGDKLGIFGSIDFYQKVAYDQGSSYNDLKNSLIRGYLNTYRKTNTVLNQKNDISENMQGVKSEETEGVKLHSEEYSIATPNTISSKDDLVERVPHGVMLQGATPKDDLFERVPHGVMLQGVTSKIFNEVLENDAEEIERVPHGVMLQGIVGDEQVKFSEIKVVETPEEEIQVSDDVVSKDEVVKVSNGIILVRGMKPVVTQGDTRNEGISDEGAIVEEDVTEDGITDNSTSISSDNDDNISEKEFFSRRRGRVFIEEDESGDDFKFKRPSRFRHNRHYNDEDGVSLEDLRKKPKKEEPTKESKGGVWERPIRSSRGAERSSPLKDSQEKVSSSKKSIKSDDSKSTKEKEGISNQVSGVSSKPKKEKVSYANVRDFVKKNKGCTVEEAKEYFSAKDIKKALMNSKIVEKKGKLYVV